MTRSKELATQDLAAVCKDLTWLEFNIDSCLRELNPDATALREANLELERALSADAHKQFLEDSAELTKKRKYNVSGTTKLRWLLDSDAPTFQKVDESTAEAYRRRLLQYYHPDKPTGDPEAFALVQMAVATSSMEMLALMMLGLGETIDAEDIDRYAGAAFQRLMKMRAGPSCRVMKLSRTGNVAQAKTVLQELIDTRAKLNRIAMLSKYATPSNNVNE